MFYDNFINALAVLFSSNRLYFGQEQYFSLVHWQLLLKQIPCGCIPQQRNNTKATRAWQPELSLFVWIMDIFLKINQHFGCWGRGKCSVYCLCNLRTMALRAMDFGRETFFFSKKAYVQAQYVNLNLEVLWFKPSRRLELTWPATLLLMPTLTHCPHQWGPPKRLCRVWLENHRSVKCACTGC